MNQGRPSIADLVNPTAEEITAWAYSGTDEPMQDWHIIVADVALPTVLLRLISDPGCPSRRYLLRSLYCVVGHSDRSDSRLQDAVLMAERLNQPWLARWARRVRAVIEHPESFNRQDWCGWQG